MLRNHRRRLLHIIRIIISYHRHRLPLLINSIRHARTIDSSLRQHPIINLLLSVRSITTRYQHQLLQIHRIHHILSLLSSPIINRHNSSPRQQTTIIDRGRQRNSNIRVRNQRKSSNRSSTNNINHQQSIINRQQAIINQHHLHHSHHLNLCASHHSIILQHRQYRSRLSINHRTYSLPLLLPRRCRCLSTPTTLRLITLPSPLRFRLLDSIHRCHHSLPIRSHRCRLPSSTLYAHHRQRSSYCLQMYRNSTTTAMMIIGATMMI